MNGRINEKLEALRQLLEAKDKLNPDTGLRARQKGDQKIGSCVCSRPHFGQLPFKGGKRDCVCSRSPVFGPRTKEVPSGMDNRVGVDVDKRGNPLPQDDED